MDRKNEDHGILLGVGWLVHDRADEAVPPFRHDPGEQVVAGAIRPRGQFQRPRAQPNRVVRHALAAGLVHEPAAYIKTGDRAGHGASAVLLAAVLEGRGIQQQ